MYELLKMGVNTRNMYSCLQKYNKLNKSHLVGQLLKFVTTVFKYPEEHSMKFYSVVLSDDLCQLIRYEWKRGVEGRR